ncbi:monocarboxylate transporter 12-like [Gigantopelta aegis]|uniref:monocarboxylate transporter 12-like n=1 Tax=Gigantopelta aegis TaxID=1735272 RepID=UPI001B888C9A|nr:monocarboxylate transporter 12-like [Gigantopelta aegis]
MEQSQNDTDKSLLSNAGGHHKRTRHQKPPIDRGWAWVVMSVCFCNYFILVGLLISGGIFFVEFLLLYQGSTSMTAVISGVLSVSISTAAFVSQNILLSFIQVRTIVMCGGLVASTGIILASFANSIATTIVSYSMLTGFGIGMVLIPELVLLGTYFHKRRSLAMAIAMVGVNAGGMTVPMFITFLIDEYSLRGALLIYGGIMLNTIVAGALLRPLKLQSNDTSDTEDTVDDNLITENGSNVYKETVDKKEIPAKAHDKTYSLKDMDSDRIDKNDIPANSNGKTYSLKDMDSERIDKKDISANANGKTYSLKDMDSERTDKKDISANANGKTYSLKDMDSERIDKKEMPGNANGKTYSLKDLVSVDSVWTRAKDVNETSNRDKRSGDIFDALIPPMRHRTFSESHKTAPKRGLNNSIINLQFASTPNIMCASLPSLNQFAIENEECNHNNSTDTESAVKSKSPFQRIFHILDCSLFSNPLFILLVINALFGILVGALPTVYIPALAVSKGLTKQKTPILLSAVSASGIVSRLLIGVFADWGCIRKHVLLIICFVFSGITFFLVTVVSDLTSLLVFCVSYGFFGSIYFSLMPVIIVDFLGLEKLAKCYGFIEFFHGACLVASHPFFGFLCDMTGNYDTSFHFLGVACFAGAFCLSLEPVARRLQERRQTKLKQFSK